MKKAPWPIVGWLGITLIAGSASWSLSKTDTLLNDLSSTDAKTRQKAHAALVEMGPNVLDAALQRMRTENKTTVVWARRTADRVVYNATALGKKKDRREVERILLGFLEGDSDRTQQDAALRLLSLIGSKESVPMLADWMRVRTMRERIRRTLERIPGSQATGAFVDALSNTREASWKADLLKTLGARGDLRAKSAVIEAFDDPDATVRLAAITAAGKLPHTRTLRGLWKVWERSATGQEREIAADSLLRIAERYLEREKTRSAEAIYRRLNLEAKTSLIRNAGLAGQERAQRAR